MRAGVDWKCALSLELQDSGFDSTVLFEFRARLFQEERLHRYYVRGGNVRIPHSAAGRREFAEMAGREFLEIQVIKRKRKLFCFNADNQQ